MTSASASRVTRSSRSLRLAIVVFAGVLAVATVLRAQETPPAATAPAPAATSPAVPAAGSDAESTTEPQGSAAAAVPEEGEAAGESPAAPDGPPPASADRARPVGPTPGRFEPTEKVRADFDVSFPIDI